MEGVPPALRADAGLEEQGDSRLRPDEPRMYGGREELMQQVPDRQGEFVRVPKIATAADG